MCPNSFQDVFSKDFSAYASVWIFSTEILLITWNLEFTVRKSNTFGNKRNIALFDGSSTTWSGTCNYHTTAYSV